MKKKRKWRLKTGMSNAKSWLRQPLIIISIVAFFAFIGMTMSLADPCGRYSELVHGVCSDGSPPSSPLDGALLIGGIVLLIMIPVILSQDIGTKPNMSIKQSFKGLVKYIKDSRAKTPKWRKRLFPVTFSLVYAPIALVAYLIGADSGYRWYNYVAIYGVLLPSVAAGLAGTLLTKWRKYTRANKTPSRSS